MSPLTNDLSSLPRAAQADDRTGLLPDTDPRFIGVLAESWQAEDIAKGDKPLATETARFRHSDAGKCARLIAYKAAGVPASDPMDLSGVNNVHIGTMLHDAWQEALPDLAECEAEVVVESLEGDGAGHVDAVIEGVDRKIAYELKTVGGFAFKAAIGKASRGRPAEGPKSDHILQASINGASLDADEVVVGYLAKEALSVNMAKGLPELARFAAEWTFTREQYAPLAEREFARVRGILDLLDGGELAARKIPDLPKGAEIVDPTTGRWEQRDADGNLVDTGSFWSCSYCSHQSLCAKTDPGRITYGSVVAVTEVA